MAWHQIGVKLLDEPMTAYWHMAASLGLDELKKI